MREFPIFVPFEDDHIAAVITVPDAEPRGLVQLLQGGGGQSRSHRNRTWIRLARGLGERDIASIRMDYPGLGDSTGSPRLDAESPRADAAIAVARVAIDALDVDRFALVGNCIGIPTALELAPRMASCMGVVCIVPVALSPLMERRKPGRATAAVRAAGHRMPALRRVARELRMLGVLQSRSATRLRPELGTILASARVLILHGGTQDTWPRLRGHIDRLRAELDDERAEHLTLRALPTEGPGFRELRFQQAMVDECVEWLDEIFPSSDEVADDVRMRTRTAMR